MILEILLAIIFVLVFSLIIYCRWNYGKLESLGIPVVKPFFIFGSNYKEPYIYVQQEDIRRQKEYGMVYGVYDGRYPMIYISDPALIRLITTVDFDYFPNHNWDILGSGTGQTIFENILDVLKDDKWKTVRAALTPIFTGAKLKQLNKVVHQYSEDYAETLFKRDDLQNFSFREYIAPMIIEALGKCFCGIDIPNAKDPENAFIAQMKGALMHDWPQDDWKSLIPKIAPSEILMKIMPNWYGDDDGMGFFVNQVKNILKAREEMDGGTEFPDATSTFVEMMKKVRTDEKYKRLGINETVVLAQAWEVFGASYLGFRDTFEFLMYELAMNQDCQEKVYAEIVGSSDPLTGELPYLQACIQEVTRLHLAFSRPERVCVKDWEHDGLRIPKGLQVVFPVAALHMNPDFYPEPEKYNPERFMSGVTRDPYTYLAFGQGPRGCIGQRFALQMLKVMAVSFLRRFKIDKRPNTKLQPKLGGSFIVSYEPVCIDLVKRQ